MMADNKLPLVILAGSDREPAVMPESGADKHPLVGSKGFDVRIGGRHLIDLLLERLTASDAFGEIFIAGPARTYGERWNGVEVIDTDGSLGQNIEASVAHLVDRFSDGPVAMTTCDILPDLDELRRVMADYYDHTPLNFWFPLIVAPEERARLGASGWKPRYRVARSEGEPSKSILPGHIIVVDTVAIRKWLVFRAFHFAYKTRNRGVFSRLLVMVWGVLSGLLVRDLRRLVRLRPPTITLSVLSHAVRLAVPLRAGSITTVQLAARFHGLFMRHEHTRQFPERSGRLPMLDALSLAKDIDTEEEALERAREFEESQESPP